MRYVVFTDIHANLEALEAVLAKIDELAKQQPIDHIWFLGDLVGYGPNPNECIDKLLARTQTIIAGNHDWAAVGKIDLDDFSAAARISAEWTAQQLTEEHRNFLTNLPERLEIGECTLVHGSPYGPLWEYLTSEVLAERSFQYFKSRYCFVGHTHVPVIYQQPDDVATTPTSPLSDTEQQQMLVAATPLSLQDDNFEDEGKDEETKEMAAVRPAAQMNAANSTVEGTAIETANGIASAESKPEQETFETAAVSQHDHAAAEPHISASEDTEDIVGDEEADKNVIVEDTSLDDEGEEQPSVTEITPQEAIASAEDRLNGEIEELLALLGLSQSMVHVTNEMIVPPEGKWEVPEGYRAIINPGGVGQPRDGDPRAAFMIYDTEEGFTFYRVPYDIQKTQEKIIKAGLPQYLAARLEYGR